MRIGALVVLASVALAGCGGQVINSLRAGGLPTHGRFATSKASGDFAIAQTAGTVIAPSRVQFVIDATPRQQASATWDLVCNENGGGVGSKSGQSTVEAPAVLTLPTPASSYKCIVSVNSQVPQSGQIPVKLRGRAAHGTTRTTAALPLRHRTANKATAYIRPRRAVNVLTGTASKEHRERVISFPRGPRTDGWFVR